MNLEEVERFIEMIESYDRTESYFSYPFIKNALDQIIISVPQFKIDIGKKFIRGRVHTNNEKYFKNISQISYHQEPFLIKDFGRANEPCQSMFYCSDNETTSFIETCSITREEKDKDFELITWGTWEVIKPFCISYVIANDNHSGKNETHKLISKKFDEFLLTMTEETSLPLKIFHDFLSKKFQLKALGHAAMYKITSAYTNWVFNERFYAHGDDERKPETIGGLMYSSTLWPDEGMNLAIRPEIVDNHLKLIDVQREHVVRTGDLYDGTDRIAVKKIDYSNDRLHWH